MNKIFLWAPCLDKVGTYQALINSAISFKRYSKELFLVYIINVCGEWDHKKEFFKKRNIKVIDLSFSYFRFLPKIGFLGSRFSYLLIFLISVFPLIKLLIRQKPNYFIGYLITSLPIILINCLNLDLKFVLRISGFPRLGFIRKNLWKFFSKKIYKITCPSIDLKNQLIDLKFFDPKKIFFLPDPVINIEKFIDQIKEEKIGNLKTKKKFFIAVGRLTKQKNFIYLINEFSEFSNKNLEYDLLIFGEGEERRNLENQINRLNLNKRIFLMGFQENVYAYMKKAEALILSSLWEDPGFVIIEASLCNLFVISSNCKNGPSEFLDNGKGGILFENNKINDLKDSLEKFCLLDDKKKIILISKKNSRKYTLFSHFNYFKKILLN